MKVVSLFSGCGGLDLGFSQAGFNVVFANDSDPHIWESYELNHPHTEFNKQDIRELKPKDIPDCIGVIGGPPCQSWSIAGKREGEDSPKGKLFYQYLEIVKEKNPWFFLAENVKGILNSKHSQAFEKIISGFEDLGYNTSYKVVNANNYGVPQDRERVFIVGYQKSLGIEFQFPASMPDKPTLKDAISDLSLIEPSKIKRLLETPNKIPNHEYLEDSYSSHYMSRNRVRTWEEPSFTIPASARHVPLHPQANKMIRVSRDKQVFDPHSPKPYRRLSVRECARIQTFPDDFVFKYKVIHHGYKMVGNAVPVALARILAKQIYKDIEYVGY